MKIKILKCSDPILWYNKHVGETFNVVKIHYGMYWCREKDEYKAVNFIHSQDVEVIEDSLT